MATIIAIILVLILMTVVIFFILKNTVSNINEQGRVYFTLKLQQYEKEYNSKTTNEGHKGLEEKREVKNVKDIIGGKKQGSLVYVDEKLDYQVSDLLALVKKIEQGFIIDNEEVVKKFIKEKTDKDNIKRYNKLKQVQDYILKIGVYQILTSNDEGFMETVESEIEKIDHKIYQKYIMTNDYFEIEDFLNYLENEIGTCDPTVYVIVGAEDENYDHIDERIETVYDEKVYKGIKIIYRNKLYDYSLG